VAVALLEYRLNIDVPVNYFYNGGGTLVITGAAARISLSTNIALATLGFFDGEWVYDIEHNIWHIIKLTGTTDGYIWTAYNGEIYKDFNTNELFNFKTAPPIWINKYLTLISEYDTLVAQITKDMQDRGISQSSISSASPEFKNLIDIVNRMNLRAEVLAGKNNNSPPTFALSFDGHEYKITVPLLMMLAKSVKQKPNPYEVLKHRKKALQAAGRGI